MQDLSIGLGKSDDFSTPDGVRAAAFAPAFATFRSQVGASISSVAFRNAEWEQQDQQDQRCITLPPTAFIA